MSTKSILIVESPSKAKTISKYLGGEYRVLASIGHIKDLPKKQLGVDVDNDFSITEIVLPDKKDFLKELKTLAKSASKIVIATDPDREGEAIAAHIASELEGISISRVQFTEITRAGIEEGMSHPSSVDQDLVSAQRTRRIIDRLIGYKVSPVLWSTLQKNMKFVEVTLSAGRVQSVALKMTVERERLRAAFRSATYYNLTTHLSTESAHTFSAILRHLDGKRIANGKDFDPNTGKLNNVNVLLLTQAQANTLVDELKPGPWTVGEVKEKIHNSHPGPPFTTSTLQQEAARKLRFPARKTMRTAQQLYEAGYITYMRTDSTQLSNEAINGTRYEIKRRFGDEYLPAKPVFYVSKVKNAQEAHEAIRPAGSRFKDVDTVSAALGNDASRLYNLIWKRTLASQMKPAKLKRVIVDIENQKTLFRATGRVILFPGYMAAYVEGSDDPNAELANKEKILPELVSGQRLSCEKLDAEEHITKPPARYTEASLVKEMEALGIGRPSTFANILDTIQHRTYVTNNKGKLTPTYLGFAVTQLLENHYEPLVDTQFTARMEDSLDAISRGEKEALPFIHRFYFGSTDRPGLETMLDDQVDISRACTIPIDSESNNPISVRIGRYGPYLLQGKNRRNISLNLALGDITRELAEELLAKPENEETLLGVDDSSGESIYLKAGPYGPYVQIGDTKTRKSIPKGIEIEDVNIEMAKKLLALPRLVGLHPESGEEILADYGRYGPYLKMGKNNKSLPPNETPLNITLERAVELLSQAKKGSTVLRELGLHPTTGENLSIKTGRFGPYVTDGKTNASVPRGSDLETYSLEEATELINKRRAAGPKKKSRRKKK